MGTYVAQSASLVLLIKEEDCACIHTLAQDPTQSDANNPMVFCRVQTLLASCCHHGLGEQFAGFQGWGSLEL